MSSGLKEYATSGGQRLMDKVGRSLCDYLILHIHIASIKIFKYRLVDSIRATEPYNINNNKVRIKNWQGEKENTKHQLQQ